MQVERIIGEHKQELTRAAEDCPECPAKMDTWQTQYLNSGYDYIQWICSNDACGHREHRTLFHDDPAVNSQLIDW